MLRKTKLIVALTFAGFSSFVAVQAAPVTSLIDNDSNQIFERRGADDGKGHVKGEGAGHPLIQDVEIVARRGRGADDPKGHVKGEGAGHPLIQDVEIVARRGRGADDPKGHVKGEGAGHPLIQDVEIVARRGRGADDAPGHIRREDRRADRRQA